MPEALKHNILCSKVLKEGLKWEPEDINFSMHMAKALQRWDAMRQP